MILPFPERGSRQPPQVDWLPLPLAPRANTRIRFAATGTRPMPPEQAMEWLADLQARRNSIGGIDIHGPGDALAEPRQLFHFLDLFRRRQPDLAIRLTTSGLGSAALASRLADSGVSEVVLQVDAVQIDIIQRLYAWIRPGRRTIPLAQAAAQLAREQADGARALARAGLVVRVTTTVYPGFNDSHVAEIARKMASRQVTSMMVLPFTGAAPEAAAENDCPLPCDTITLARARRQAADHLALTETPPEAPEAVNLVPLREHGLPGPTDQRPHVAVASSNGMDIDLHLGQAARLLIYGPREDGLACLLEARTVAPVPAGVARWQHLADSCLKDCFAVLVANAGEAPKKVLAGLGIRVLVCPDNIEGTVDVLFGGGKKKKPGQQPR